MAEPREPDQAAWIVVVPDDEWTSSGLADLYDEVVDRENGKVDHILAVHSLNPKGMAAHTAVYGSAMSGSASLRKVERELIALVVSLENHCHY